jgi:hypothetical protein
MFVGIVQVLKIGLVERVVIYLLDAWAILIEMKMVFLANMM